jgi:hypothetical protein
VPANQNPKPTDGVKGAVDFDALMSKLTDVSQIPSKDKMQHLQEAIHEGFEPLSKMVVAASFLLKVRYDALLKAGFTHEQIVELGLLKNS